MILKIFGWTASIAVLALLVWQTAAAEPLWPRVISSTLLMVISVLAGLRIGADSAAAYIKDLQRLNKVVIEQNRDLQEANAMLIKQIDSESVASSAPSQPRPSR